MYLKQIYIENNGPLKNLDLSLSFKSDGDPIPTVFVGSNGSGKPNLLSICADAIFEAAANHYTDVTNGNTGIQRNWFRVVGGVTGTLGEPAGLVLLRFNHNETDYFFREKRGQIVASEAVKRVPESLRSPVNWGDTAESLKDFPISPDKVVEIFGNGAYAYFPASRAEIPHWLNHNSLPSADFNLSMKFSTSLAKPIYLERSLEQFQQWLLTVILEARHDIALVPNEAGQGMNIQLVGNVGQGLTAQSVLISANKILSIILGAEARFVWMGRGNPNKIGISIGQDVKVPTLGALSGGQSTLLATFATLLRYADNGQWSGALPLQNITGICIIDEIDAHMHIDLQHRALPELIKLFPKVQFLVSSHSPLFGLGMEQNFGSDGVEIIDMPTGTRLQAEAYSEFGRALQALQDTKAFAEVIKNSVEKPGKLLVLLEGETDPVYLTTAAQLLGREPLLDVAEFQWVGAKDPKSGQGFHTGKDALNQTRATLLANPTFVHRPVLLLYDNDTNKSAEDSNLVHVRSMTKPQGSKVKNGIESLLPSHVIIDEMFDVITKDKPDGGHTSVTNLNKMKLCNYVCETRRDPSDFESFVATLDEVEAIAALHSIPKVPN